MHVFWMLFFWFVYGCDITEMWMNFSTFWDL